MSFPQSDIFLEGGPLFILLEHNTFSKMVERVGSFPQGMGMDKDPGIYGDGLRNFFRN